MRRPDDQSRKNLNRSCASALKVAQSSCADASLSSGYRSLSHVPEPRHASCLLGLLFRVSISSRSPRRSSWRSLLKMRRLGIIFPNRYEMRSRQLQHLAKSGR